MIKRLLLVDGSSYLYRAFHAMPDLRNRAGEPTGAIYGMVNMLNSLRSTYQTGEAVEDCIACIFDAPGKTFRDDWYPDYKATRSSMPEDLAAQIPAIHEVISALGWPILMVSGVEADDVIGTLAARAVGNGYDRIVISTGDKDLAQLVNDKVSLVNTMSNTVLDPPGVVEKFGVPPERIVDYLTLTGDVVDNVPGVEKVGPKTAAKWINQYGSLDGVIAHADKISGVVGENLRKALDWLPKARALITVKCDVDLTGEVPSFEVLASRGPDKQALKELYRRFEFKSWFQALGGADNGPGGNTAKVSTSANPAVGQGDLFSDPPADPPSGASVGAAVASDKETTAAQPNSLFERAPTTAADIDCILVNTPESFSELQALLKSAELVCFDTETSSLDPMTAKMVGLAFAVNAGRGYYVPLAHCGLDAEVQLPLGDVLASLKPWFEDAACSKVAQNAKYDLHVMANHGIHVAGLCEDTMLESYVLEAHRPHNMDALALRWVNHKAISYEEVAGKGAAQVGFADVPIATACRYSAEDAEVTLRLHQTLFPHLQASPQLLSVYRDIEVPVSAVLFDIERRGVLIDVEKLQAQSHFLGKRLLEIEQEAFGLAGQSFNLNSPKQIGELLFEKLKLPVVKKTPGGTPSTDEEVLSKLAEDYPLPKCLLEHRSLAKLKSTYTDKLPRMVNAETGRVHTNYAQAVAVTGRLASNDPNLQNIPIRTPEGRRVREAFVAPPEHLIVSADYSQIELRIMAHISGDQALCQAFAEGEDVHRATASEIFGVPRSEVSSDQRRTAKVINFGLIYGMSAFGLAANLGIEREAAKMYIDRYFTRYPGVAKYMEQTRTQAKAQGFVETVFGRRLWLPEINSGNGPRRAAAERAAINAPMQGTAADLIKKAMIAIHKGLPDAGLKARMVMQVHDEVVLEVPTAELEAVKALLTQSMTKVADLRVPLEISIGVGSNWDEAH
ncbi:MAG: DNA polymerase I [Burkholderiales bacterium]|nr:DNA polymerase I [Burkholderiales bacterium]